MPVEKRLASLPVETVLADCSNMAFSSTLVTYGSGIGVVMMTLLQLVFTYWPPMHALFGVAPIGWQEWGLIITAGFIVYTTVGLEKLLRRRFRRGVIDPSKLKQAPFLQSAIDLPMIRIGQKWPNQRQADQPSRRLQQRDFVHQ
ncbi:cation transporting ATPase C-terminal domain-containing protein [Methylotuvimicrobium sp.]|uniref:cation transporting ATPase C-terminal domain-containing protein n=1 Tax=Methylotuvimicrobium sp. TaxID=2822413 RepID=UPI003D65F1FB